MVSMPSLTTLIISTFATFYITPVDELEYPEGHSWDTYMARTNLSIIVQVRSIVSSFGVPDDEF